MKPKECNECGKTIMPKSKDAIWNHGYMNNMCRPCKRIEVFCWPSTLDEY